MTSSRKAGNRFGYSKKDTKENLGSCNNMEELLNKLIKKGWKPYGIDKDDIEVCSYDKNRKKISIGYMNWSSPSEGDYDWLFISLRELVSKESGLWQFVCENKMIINEHYCWDGYIHGDDNGRIEIWQKDYRYRLIESALKDESELEDFLLQNIKVDVESN